MRRRAKAPPGWQATTLPFRDGFRYSLSLIAREHGAGLQPATRAKHYSNQTGLASVLTDLLGRLIGRDASIAEGPVTMKYMRDYLRWETIEGGGGAAACFGIIFHFQPASWFAYTLTAIGLFFLVYFLQQVRNYLIVYRVDDAGVTELLAGRTRFIRWSEVERLRLHFFSQKRSRFDKGLLHLTIGAGRRKLKVDSTLDHFPTLLARAAQAARDREIYLDPTTLSNMEQLGL